jgi:hypothetical protein
LATENKPAPRRPRCDCPGCQRIAERDKLLMSFARTLERVRPGERIWIRHELAQKIREHIILIVHDE